MQKRLPRRNFLPGGVAVAGLINRIPGAPSIRLMSFAITETERTEHIIRVSSNKNP